MTAEIARIPRLPPLDESPEAMKRLRDRAALGILATCAEASAQLHDGSTALDEYPPFVRAKMLRASVAIAATVADLQADIARARRDQDALAEFQRGQQP